MRPEEPKHQLTRVAREIGAALHQQAGRRWSAVRTARRNLGDRYVWRFRIGKDQPDRFLLLSHDDMTQGENPADTLLTRLNDARWLDRLHSGPETRFKLAANGDLRGRPLD